MLKTTLLISSILFLTGCVSGNNMNKTKEKKEPKWLLDPYIENDTIAAIGCSRRHFKGIEAQKDLAISRAIDRIATQNSVIVDNVTMRQKISENGRQGISATSSSSLHTVDKIKISTKTKALYTKSNGEICAWVVQR